MPWNTQRKKRRQFFIMRLLSKQALWQGYSQAGSHSFRLGQEKEGRQLEGHLDGRVFWVLTSHVLWLPGTTLFHGHDGKRGFHTHHSCSLRCWLEHLNCVELALGWAVSKTLGCRQKYPHHFNLPLLSVRSKTEAGALRQMSQLITGVAPSGLCFLAIPIMVP